MRTFVAVVCMLVAAALAPLAVGASWLSLRADDTEAYVDSVAPLADDPTLRAELSEEVAEAAVASLESAVPVGLPDDVDRLARDASDMVVEGPAFPEFWRDANARAHRQFQAIVDEPAGAADGWVTVDLSPLVTQVVDELAGGGIPVEVLPEVSLPYPVARASDVERAAGPYRALDGAAPWLVGLWAALAALAVLAAHGWRGRLRAGGFAALGGALGAVVVMLLVGPVTDVVVDRVEPGRQGVVGLMVEAVGDDARSFAMTWLVVAGVLGVGLLAGSAWPARRAPAAAPAAAT